MPDTPSNTYEPTARPRRRWRAVLAALIVLFAAVAVGWHWRLASAHMG